MAAGEGDGTGGLRLDRFEGPGPIGTVWLVAREGVLVAMEFGEPEERLFPMLRRRFGAAVRLEAAALTGLIALIRRYFDGDLAILAEVPIDAGGTGFQRSVWEALRAIPPGETLGYGELAALLGRPRAARAVGMANGQNPISLVVPCHRLIGASGALTGYGGGLMRKEWLLAHERRG